MTIFVCCCGKAYNSDILKECPYCHAPKAEQNNLVKELLKNEEFQNAIKEIAKKVVVEMDEEDFFDHTHDSEGNME